MKLTDLIEKPFLNNLFDKFDTGLLYLNLRYIYENIFGLTEIEDDELYVFNMFFYSQYYEDFIINKHLDDSFFDNYHNLFELLNDRLNLNLSCNVCNLSCYGDMDEDEEEYIAYFDKNLTVKEFEIVDYIRNQLGYKLCNAEGIYVGEYDEFNMDIIFIYHNDEIIDYYMYDCLYDNFDMFNLHNFIEYLFKACPYLFSNDSGLINKFLEYKKNKETKEIVF